MLKDDKSIGNPFSSKGSPPSLYLVIFILLFCSRLFDMSTTYLATPNLTLESNIMVRTMELGWFRFIVLNILITLMIFLLFKFSWSKYSNGKTSRHIDEQNPKPRNIPLEIGITLPIYVIITGYFQGLINIMIYMELILISFTNMLFLYPIIVGGIFGSVSLYLTKKILYSKEPRFSKKAHKVMMPKSIDEHEGSSRDPEFQGILPQANQRIDKESLNKTDIITLACEGEHIHMEDI
jgi:hypothetical protein